MRTYRVKSFAKINLALNVTGKLKLLHKIESIVSFISLSDLIFIKKIISKFNKIIFRKEVEHFRELFAKTSLQLIFLLLINLSSCGH